MGHLHIRKILKRDTEYHEKGTPKHKCDFKVHAILEVTMLTGEIQYYNIYKCSKCNSFKSIEEEGNCQGKFFRPLNKREAKLPIVTADYNHRMLLPVFGDLKNVHFCKADKKKNP